jgi:site-specific recombinase XerD
MPTSRSRSESGLTTPFDGAELVTPNGQALVSSSLVESARNYAQHARADNTVASYAAALRRFEAWCEAQRLSAMPADPRTVALYLAARADQGKKINTLEHELSAIAQAHVRAGFESPRKDRHVIEVYKGIRRKLGTKARQVTPVLVAELRTMATMMRPGLIGLRDRALLTLGLAGAMRRSELVSLCVEDLEFTPQGFSFQLRRSKNNQEGARVKRTGIPFGANPGTCPVRAMRAWLDAASITTGHVFRRVDRHENVGGQLSGEAVALVVKEYAAAAGLPAERFAGHSLRRGLATQSHRQGKDLFSIMEQGRWTSLKSVQRYIDHDPFHDNAAAGIGL